MEAPPIIADPDARVAKIARWRSGLMLVLLLAAPPLLGVLGARHANGSVEGAVLPSTVSGLLVVSAVNLGILLLAGLVIAALARPTADELWARASGGWKAWALGAGYSVGLRLVLGGLAAACLVGFTLILRLQGKPVDALAGFRPEIENVLDPTALRNPWYLTLVLTLVSFVVAGFREELWRATVLAAVFRCWPSSRTSRRGPIAAAALAALVFGLGHLPQGWGGVLLTGGLGFGLGLIMLFHRSLWIPVLAHGFFNATSFLLLRGADQLGLLEQVLGKSAAP